MQGKPPAAHGVGITHLSQLTITPTTNHRGQPDDNPFEIYFHN